MTLSFQGTLWPQTAASSPEDADRKRRTLDLIPPQTAVDAETRPDAGTRPPRRRL